jgi:hypothetical protein
MPVLTTDVLVEGHRRDDVLDWLAQPAHHGLLLQGAFDGVEEHAPGHYTLVLRVGPRPRRVDYRFDRVDADHGGRRVLVTTTGGRVDGRLHYSLRTVKPSTNTLVTLHLDYATGGPLGFLVEQLGLRAALERGARMVLQNLSRALPAPT